MFIVAAGAALTSGSAVAQSYPNKPIRMIIPFPPGGGNDVIARLVGQKLSTRLGPPVVLGNRAGANGFVGVSAMMNVAPDGYTLGIAAAGPMAVNPALHEKLAYAPIKDFSPIVNMVIYPLLLATHPSVPAKTIDQARIHAAHDEGRGLAEGHASDRRHGARSRLPHALVQRLRADLQRAMAQGLGQSDTAAVSEVLAQMAGSAPVARDH